MIDLQAPTQFRAWERSNPWFLTRLNSIDSIEIPS